MARTTAAKIIAIMDTSLTVSDISEFPDMADVFIDSYLLNRGLGDTLLAEIARWIGAHLVASGKEQAVKSEGASGANVTYQGRSEMMLMGTKYGQQAVMLDSSGTLSQLGLRPATVEVIDFIDGGTGS